MPSVFCFALVFKGKTRSKTQFGQVLVGQFQDIFKQIPVQCFSALNTTIQEIQVFLHVKKKLRHFKEQTQYFRHTSQLCYQ